MKRERFTEFKPYRQGESEGRYVQYAVTGCGNDSDHKGDYTTGASVDRLAELENGVEQGTVIELPCKVGDTIYIPWIYDGVEGISSHEISAIEINKDGIYLVFYVDTDVHYLWVNVYNQGRFNLSLLGKKFFLTRKKDRKRLKELQR